MRPSTQKRQIALIDLSDPRRQGVDYRDTFLESDSGSD